MTEEPAVCTSARAGSRPASVHASSSPEKLARSFGNLVEVRPFVGDPDDRELELLERFLIELGPVANVRTIEKRGWRSRFSPGSG